MRFIIFARLLGGVGDSTRSRAFSLSPACLRLCWCAASECRRSVRVCAASTKIRVRGDGWSICAEARLLIVAPPCRSRWRSRTWESRLEWLWRGASRFNCLQAEVCVCVCLSPGRKTGSPGQCHGEGLPGGTDPRLGRNWDAQVAGRRGDVENQESRMLLCCSARSSGKAPFSSNHVS